jgi:hypothetical protein
LTIVSVQGTNVESRSRTGRHPATPAAGASAVPAGGGSSPPLPGGFGHHACRHYDRHARCIAAIGAGAGGGNPPPIGVVSREAWPEAEPLG